MATISPERIALFPVGKVITSFDPIAQPRSNTV
jgi:hypothetical protein